MPPAADRRSNDANVSPRCEARADNSGGFDSSPAPSSAGSVLLADAAGGARIDFGGLGDAPLVAALLARLQRHSAADPPPDRGDEPGCRPSDQLLLRQGAELVGHVRLVQHYAWFEAVRTPLVRLEDFVVTPGLHASQQRADLLAAACQVAQREGAIAAITSTDDDATFERHGWTALRGQGHTRADASRVLAHLDAQSAVLHRKRRRPTIDVRTWKQFELDKIIHIYDQTAPGGWGARCRSEAYWQWLVDGTAQDQLLLACQPLKASADVANHAAKSSESNAPHKQREPRDSVEQVAAYAVVRGGCIVELAALPASSRARVHLLARACRDALDRGLRGITLYTPAADPLHELLVTAGGGWIAPVPGQPRLMFRLLDPYKWVERMYPVWQRRAREAGIARPLRIVLQGGDAGKCAGVGEATQFTFTRRSSRLERADPKTAPAGVVQGAPTVVESLLTGNLSIPRALEQQALVCRPAELAAILAAIFAPRLFWQSPLDLLRA